MTIRQFICHRITYHNNSWCIGRAFLPTNSDGLEILKTTELEAYLIGTLAVSLAYQVLKNQNVKLGKLLHKQSPLSIQLLDFVPNLPLEG